MKTLKTLKFTEKPAGAGYGPDSGFFSLGKIDKREGICETRTSEDEVLAGKYGTFQRCAEQALKNWGNPEKDKSLIFCHDISQHEKVSLFVQNFEKLLNLEQKSIVFPTSNPKISAIRVSEFWRLQPLRRGIFLLLIRAGRTFGSDENVWACIKRDPLLSKCIPALELFFSGYNIFHGSCDEILKQKLTFGFVYQFNGKSKEQIENKMLFTSEAAALSFGGSIEEEPEEYDEDEDDGPPDAW